MQKPESAVSISILLPAHNASRTISLALASTMMFKPKNSEILIFLDGNNTNSKLLSYASARTDVHVFKSEEKIGISKALNFLLGQARAEIVARMDADDISLPGRFKKAIGRIKKNESDFVFLNTILFGWSSFPLLLLPQLPIKLEPKQSELMLILANPFSHPTMVARKSAIFALGGYRHSVAEDYDLWLRAQIAGYRLSRLRGYGLLYRRHPNQITQQPAFKEQEKIDPPLMESQNAWASKYFGESNIETLDPLRKAILIESLCRSSFWLRFQLTVLPGILSRLNIRF